MLTFNGVSVIIYYGVIQLAHYIGPLLGYGDFLIEILFFCQLLGGAPGAPPVSSQAVEVLLWPSPSVCA
jgi:hypothetical protein